MVTFSSNKYIRFVVISLLYAVSASEGLLATKSVEDAVVELIAPLIQEMKKAQEDSKTATLESVYADLDAMVAKNIKVLKEGGISSSGPSSLPEKLKGRTRTLAERLADRFVDTAAASIENTANLAFAQAEEEASQIESKVAGIIAGGRAVPAGAKMSADKSKAFDVATKKFIPVKKVGARYFFVEEKPAQKSSAQGSKGNSLAEAYKTLNVDVGAPFSTVKQQYRLKTLQYHPDRNPAGKEQFQRIQNAYELLKNKYEADQENGNK